MRQEPLCVFLLFCKIVFPKVSGPSLKRNSLTPTPTPTPTPAPLAHTGTSLVRDKCTDHVGRRTKPVSCSVCLHFALHARRDLLLLLLLLLLFIFLHNGKERSVARTTEREREREGGGGAGSV